jgi:hypothetical protein
MTRDPRNLREKESGGCLEQTTEALHHYLDGELPVSEQPRVFQHLASCAECRQLMDSVMSFRRMSRQEYIALPPASDDAFFSRLTQQKELSERVDRAADRDPLWKARRSVSVRSALAIATVVFLFGLMLPMPARTSYTQPLIHLSAETVDLSNSDSVVIESPIYFYVDGPTVEAVRASDFVEADQSRSKQSPSNQSGSNQ